MHFNVFIFKFSQRDDLSIYLFILGSAIKCIGSFMTSKRLGCIIICGIHWKIPMLFLLSSYLDPTPCPTSDNAALPLHCSSSYFSECSTLQRQSRLNIPFLGIARPQPQFPYSCVFQRFIYSQDQSMYFLQQNRQTHRGNI